MSITPAMIKKGKKKFLVKSKGSFLTREFLRKTNEELKDYKLIECFDLQSFSEAYESLNLFDQSRKLVVLQNVLKDDLEALGEMLDNDVSEDIAVLVEQETLLKTKAYTRLKSLCEYVELKQPREAACAVHVRDWMKSYDMEFPEELPSYIVARVGSDLSRLRNEVKKMSYLLKEEGERTATKLVADQLMSSEVSSSYFSIMEAVFRKKVSEAIEEVSKIDEYSYTALIHFMINQVEKIYKVAIYKEQGKSPEDIADLVGVPVFIVKTKMISVLSFYPKIKLLKMQDILNELDVDIRLSSYPKNLVMESYLLRIHRL